MKEKLLTLVFDLLIYILIISCFLGVYWLGLNSYVLYKKGINSAFILSGLFFIFNIIFILFIMKKRR
uniref:Uncharacterized protein n=1 Tax=Aliarcobacter butzleri TaxID=28197 RepID=W0LW19_9BACT|nr:hypothetical protein [Aliarcobacter butzleri]